MLSFFVEKTCLHFLSVYFFFSLVFSACHPMQNAGVSYERKEDALGRHVEHLFEEFFDRCLDQDSGQPRSDEEVKRAQYYRSQFEALNISHSRSTILMDFQHLREYDDLLADAVVDKYFRLEPYIKNALSSIYVRYIQDGSLENIDRKDIWVAFYNLPKVLKVRDLKTEFVSKLTCISGTVTRTNQVRPELMQGKFQCLDCQTPSDMIEQQFKYTEPVKCRNAACQNTRRWLLLVGESKFCDWQKVRIQENSEEIPSGSMPRTMDIILRNDAVETAKAGDKCRFVGSLVVVPEVAKLFGGVDRREVIRAQPGGDLAGKEGRSDTANPTEGATGLKGLGVRDLNHKLCFLASTVHQEDERQGFRMMSKEVMEGEETFTEEEEERVLQMAGDENLMSHLSQNVCPNVWGHEDIKTGILLQLYGGVHKRTKEGISLRGDINCCIVGDPSVAKSQFLKYVHKLIPRAVYTSGKASSAAGLTASVIKDVETREFSIEAGALMLADNGLCCIDEFDKMDTDDQVAIHEAMEQQTISIAKAGIKATLNARTSILAAANPIGGRYDTRKPLKANVGLSPPIMSRFDLFFVVLDDLSPEADYRLADHIVGLHQQGEASLPTHYTPEDFLLFRRKGKNMHPILTEGAQRMLVACYRDLRQNDKTKKNNSYRITTRQLESMIRLSEAVARVHLSQEVKEEHVKLALHVMRSSFTRVEQPSVEVVMPRGTAEEAKTKGKSKDSAVEKVPMEHYQRIRVLLLTKLCSTDEITRKGISENELKQWYFDTVQEVQEAALLQEVELVDKVLERLIAEEAITVITVLDEVGDQPEASGNRLLAIHPNLPPDSIAQDTR